MWDNVALLRNIANTMLSFSLMAGLYGAGYYLLHQPGVFSIRSVQLSVAPQHVVTDQVRQVLRASVQGNLVTIDIEHLRNELEQLPWVRKVNIRRKFPSQLLVQFEEHQALAHWNNSGLVNLQGEVFVAELETGIPERTHDSKKLFSRGSDQVLPIFSGADGTSAELTHNYTLFSRQLAVLDLRVKELMVSPRHAWQIRLSSGTVLELGREDMQQRLARFVAAYPYSLVTQNTRDKEHESADSVAYVDLRYRNGFAVRRSTSEKG